MDKRKIIAIIIAILLVAVPAAIAAVTYTQNIAFQGTGTLPNHPPTTSPSPTPETQTTHFSLFFPDGNPLTTITPQEFQVPILFDSNGFSNYNFQFIVKNDGETPINIANAELKNVEVQQGTDWQMALEKGPFAAINTTNTLQPGDSALCGTVLYFVFLPNQPYTYTQGSSFSYSFDLQVTVTKA